MLRACNLMGKVTTAHDLKSPTNSDNSTADEGESDLAMALLSEEPLQPAIMSAALTGPYADQYQQAIEREFHSFATNSTFVLATIQDLQAHLWSKDRPLHAVAQGEKDTQWRPGFQSATCSHRPHTGALFQSDSSPVMALQSLPVLLALLPTQEWTLGQMDVKTAYMNAELSDEAVFMRLPANWPHHLSSGATSETNNLVRLYHAFCGLPQSGKLWYLTLPASMTSTGFCGHRE
jgi:hypothetical protein